MAGKSDFAGQKVIGHLLGLRALAPPASYFIRLYTVMPSDAGTGGTEVAGNGYAALEVDNDTTNFVFNADNNIENGEQFAFPAADGGDWGIIVGFGFWSLAAGGDAWFINELESPIEILDGQIFRFEPGTLVFIES